MIHMLSLGPGLLIPPPEPRRSLSSAMCGRVRSSSFLQDAPIIILFHDHHFLWGSQLEPEQADCQISYPGLCLYLDVVYTTIVCSPGVIAANWQLARLLLFDVLTKLAAKFNELRSPVHIQFMPSRYRRSADANIRSLDVEDFDSNDSSFQQLSFAIRALLQLCATCRCTNSRVMLSLGLSSSCHRREAEDSFQTS